VDVHNGVAELSKERERYRCVVDECSRFGGRQNLAANDESPVVVVVYIGLGEELSQVDTFDVELCFNDAFLLRVGEDLCVGPLSKQKRESSEQYRFAGAGLAGDGNESVVETDVGESD